MSACRYAPGMSAVATSLCCLALMLEVKNTDSVATVGEEDVPADSEVDAAISEIRERAKKTAKLAKLRRKKNRRVDKTIRL